MTDIVDDTLAQWRRGGHVWGESDCLLSIGDYLAQRGHLDVAARFRGTYDDEVGAMRHVDEYGGHAGLIDLVGIPYTDDPQRGDVAVIDLGETEVGALCTGEGFAIRLERGTVEINRRFVRVLTAWSVA